MAERTYVELHAHSSYSFLDGASLPEELAVRAAELGYEALALTDHDGVYGSPPVRPPAEELAVRAAELGYEALALTDHDGVYGSLEFAHAAKAFGVRPITGAEVTLADGSHVTPLVGAAAGYAYLCRLLTSAHAGTRTPGKERELLEPALEQSELEQLNEGLVCLSGCARHAPAVRNPHP